MHLSLRQYRLTRVWVSAFLAIILLSPAALAFQGTATAPAKTAAVKLSSEERKASERVKQETIREITTALSSKEFEGRGTGQPGADKAAQYMADRFAKLGLKPGGPNGSYLQPIKFRSTQILADTSVKFGDAALKHRDDYIVLPPYTSEKVDVSGGIVFAGFGAASAELKRDDFAGLDVKDKVVIIMGGKPAGVDDAAWARATNPQARALNTFGRGAVAMVVANAGTPAQPYATIANYLSRRRVSLGAGPSAGFKPPPVLIVSDAAMEKLFAGSDTTFAQVLEKAKRGENVSRELGKTATLALRYQLGETPSSNVVAVFEGSDPKLKEEAVVYTAHYDAYGIESDGTIYPGAADNALGTATIIGIAEAFAKAFPKPESRPRRSIIFLAVTGEEYGLLGAEYWVRNPTWPLSKIAANINFDGIGTEVYAPVKRVVAFGAEHSELGTIFEEVMSATGNIVTADPMPEENAFVRSDHYSFVKQGVPALMLMGGPADDPAKWVPRMKKWLETDYHTATDTVKPDWDWSGPATLARVGMIIGLRVAEAEAMPSWKTTSPFNKPRAAAKPAAAAAQ
ncbi:MAG TPA: M28 family peptidase [Pyrinomonadaceae bacterium]|nr:M28 family peptidase [Pyrinomonadaceae bacterium]